MQAEQVRNRKVYCLLSPIYGGPKDYRFKHMLKEVSFSSLHSLLFCVSTYLSIEESPFGTQILPPKLIS